MCYTFCSCPQSLDILLCFFPSLFSLLSIFEKSLNWFCSSEILPFATSSLVINPLKTFFICVTVFLISSFYFWFFLRISISAYLPICSYMLSTSFSSALSIVNQSYLKCGVWDFLGNLVIKTLHSHWRGHVQFLVREISHIHKVQPKTIVAV